MTSTQLEALRICVLQQLREVGDGSLPISTLVLGAQLKGFTSASEEMLRATLAYLYDKSLVASVEKTLSPENKRWRITAAGIDFLAQCGL